MMSKGRSSSSSSLSRKMSKFGSALGGGGSKKSGNASASAGAGKQEAAAPASKDATDATRKLQAAINRRAQRRGAKQKVTDLKKFSTSASSSSSSGSSNSSKGAHVGADVSDGDKPQSKYLSNASTLYADPSIDALTIPTASSSHSHDSQDTHQTAGSANSASSTDSLNALARENTPHKKKKKTSLGVHVPVGSTPGRISTTINANRGSEDGEGGADDEEKDDCKDMFTPIVPRKKGRPPKRMTGATSSNADGNIMDVSKVTVQQSASNDASTIGSSATANTGSTTNHDRYEPAEQLLERAKARNEAAMQKKQMEEERAKKERQDRYQALSQLLNAEESEATIKVDNTNVFHGIDSKSAAGAAAGGPINTHVVANRSKNGTPYVPKAAVPPPALSYSYSASSEVTYRSPTAAEENGNNNGDAGLSTIGRSASQASSVTQPLYASHSLNVNGADDRVRYVRFTDVVTTFDDGEEKNAANTQLVEKGEERQPYESPFVKMHSVQHNYVGGEENRSEFEIELERKMMEHDIEVKRVGYHAQVSTTAASMQLSKNESAIQAQQRQQKAPSPNFANPLSPDYLLDGANGAYTLHVDHREITYGHKKGPNRTIAGKETRFVQDHTAVGATRGPTITQTTEGFIELEAPEATQTEYLLRKPTLSFGSQTAVSDVTESTIRHTNTGDFSSIDGDAEAKEYMYARATANTFKPPIARANGGPMQQQPQPSTSFFGGLADSMTQKLRDCVQPSYNQAILQSPPPVKMAPPAGIGGRLRDCIAPRREFMVHSPHPGSNKGMMSI